MNRATTAKTQRIIKSEHVVNSMDTNNIFVFLLLPAVSIYNAIRNIRTSYAINLIWLFCGYFGLTFVIDLESSFDSARIARELIRMHNTKLSFDILISYFYSAETGQLDIVQPLLTFIISRFTASPKILYAFFGLVFGFFYSRNLGYIIHKTNAGQGWFTALLLISFAIVVPVWYINGFRYYLAVHVFSFGALPYLFDGKKNRLLLIVFSVIIHWSFFIAAALMIAYILLGNRLTLYYLFFVITFFISLLNLEIINSIFQSYAPEALLITRSSYLSENYNIVVKESKQISSWFLDGHFEYLKWFIFFMVNLLFFKKRKLLKINLGIYNVFNFSLFFFGFINMLSVVPSVSRFFVIPTLLFLAVFYILSKDQRFQLPILLRNLSMPVLLLFIVVRIRMGLDFAGALLLFGNPLIALFIQSETSLLNFIKMIF